MAIIFLCLAVVLMCVPPPTSNPQLLRWIASALAIIALVLALLGHTGAWWPDR